MSEKLKFRISSHLKDIIGKDLITDDFVAIFELVKNSYDAFAKNVTITFEDDKIIISDDGKGMSLNDLKDKWLFVGYSGKRDGTEDALSDKNKSYRDKIKRKTHYAGAKGIGRFSSDRLGEVLTIKTQRKDLSLEEIKINWNDFEVNQKDEFQSIEVEHNSSNDTLSIFPNNSHCGTFLEINKLHDKWERKKILKLKHSLEKLINPFSQSNDFNIEIFCDKEIKKDEKEELTRNKINGLIKNSILNILELKTTQISIIINSKEIITQVIDRGNLIYHIKEDNKKFNLLENFKIDLYYLNKLAKFNFTSKMGIEPLNFGTVFLFKNGFRVYPFAEPRDDSWHLDSRAKQGHGRYLGNRDLFGKVEILTNKIKYFKDVSSRDGGLVKTDGYYQMMDAFKEKALKPLERYIVGVLWGEGFKRNKYFGEGKKAEEKIDKYRNLLKENDKNSDNISTLKLNLGSKLDFIQLIKNLSAKKDIEIIDYNKDLLNIINDNLNEIENQNKFILDLKVIAERTNDDYLKESTLNVQEKYNKLLKQKEKAEKEAKKEKKNRIKAEKEAKKEKEKREKEEKARKKAEEDKLKAEYAKIKAENDKFKAKKRAKEEKEKREKEEKLKLEALKRENKERIAKETVKEAYNEEVKRNLFLTGSEVRDKDVLEGFIHQIVLYGSNVKQQIKNILEYPSELKEMNSEDFKNILSELFEVNEKILSTSTLAINGNFRLNSSKIIMDLNTFLKEYIREVYGKDTIIKTIIDTKEFIVKFNPIEMGIVIENFINNSKKAGSTKIIFRTKVLKESLELIIEDNGDGLSNTILDKNDIFKKGFTRTDGSGLGLFFCKNIIKKIGGILKLSEVQPKIGLNFTIKVVK